MNVAAVAEVVWYVTGRFYAQGNELQDVGYFLHVQGIHDGLFSDHPRSESTALLTFASAPFTAPAIDNGGLSIGIDLKGTFDLYVRETAGATFDDPKSFAAGRCVATFKRVAIVPTVKLSVSTGMTVLSNVFSAKLVRSEPFELGGVRYDFRDLAGAGITQWGTAATEPLTPPQDYSAVVPFLGSAIRMA
jgi:hypothetical protein